jgi:hypothetical protein
LRNGAPGQASIRALAVAARLGIALRRLARELWSRAPDRARAIGSGRDARNAQRWQMACRSIVRRETAVLALLFAPVSVNARDSVHNKRAP